MKLLQIVFASVALLTPGLAPGQAIPAAAEPPMQYPVEAPPPHFVVQGPADFPEPPPGGPRLAGPAPLGPPRPVRMMPPGPGAWWRDAEIAGELQLSGAQVTRLDQASVAHRLRLVDLHAELERQELGLEPLLDVDQPEEARVTAQIDRITAARGRLEKEHVLMLLAIRRVLSIDQWKRLQALQQERARGSHVHPPGGPSDGPGRGPGIQGPPPPPR